MSNAKIRRNQENEKMLTEKKAQVSTAYERISVVVRPHRGGDINSRRGDSTNTSNTMWGLGPLSNTLMIKKSECKNTFPNRVPFPAKKTLLKCETISGTVGT